MFLAVDQGNSFLKATFIRNGEVEEVVRLLPEQIDRLPLIAEQKGVGRIAFGTVGKLDVRLVETLRNVVDGNLLLLTHGTPLPFAVKYKSIQTLGLDRVAAAAGAARIFPNEGMLIVDAGTAITSDIVSPAMEFLGGNIAPGLGLRIRSLHEAAPALPLIEPQGALPGFGYDTDTALRCGTLGAVCSEIICMFENLQKSLNLSRIVLTGGDAALIYDTISSLLSKNHMGAKKPSPQLSLQSNLVALGLLSIFEFNETSF